MSAPSQQSRILRTSGPILSCPLFIPWQRGHLYFAEKGTFLLCLDIVIFGYNVFDLVTGKVISKTSSCCCINPQTTVLALDFKRNRMRKHAQRRLK
jgi:hypothetical protein